MLTETDKSVLDDCLSKALFACNACEDSKVYLSRLSQTLTAMKMKSDQGERACRRLVLDTLRAFIPSDVPADLDGDMLDMQPETALSMKREADLCLTSAKDVRLKSSFDVEGHLSKCTKLAGFPDIVEIGTELAKHGKAIDNTIALIELILRTSSLSLQCSATGQAPHVEAMANLVRACSELKVKVADLELGGDAAIVLANFEDSLGVKDLGHQTYMAKLVEFKTDVKALLQGIDLAASDVTAGKATIKVAVTKIRKQEHELVQLTTWSSTANFDREVIELVSTHLVEFAINVEDALRCQQCVPSDFEPNWKVSTALKELINIEVTKPKLLRLASETDVDAFLATACSVNDAMQPLVSDHASDRAAKVQVLIDKLQKSMAPEDLGDEGFYKFFSVSSVSSMKTARTNAANAVKAFTQLPGIDTSEQTTEWSETLSAAKLQTSKWSLLSFAYNTEIEANTKEGIQLRQGLNAVWELNKDKEDTKKYLGEELVSRIGGLLAMKHKQVGKGGQGQGGAHATKRAAAAAAVPASDALRPARKSRKQA